MIFLWTWSYVQHIHSLHVQTENRTTSSSFEAYMEKRLYLSTLTAASSSLLCIVNLFSHIHKMVQIKTSVGKC